MNTVTLVIIGAVVAVAVLLILRLSGQLRNIQQKFAVTRENRSGRDRRRRALPVKKERRRTPRREEEVADTFVRRLEHRREE